MKATLAGDANSIASTGRTLTSTIGHLAAIPGRGHTAHPPELTKKERWPAQFGSAFTPAYSLASEDVPMLCPAVPAPRRSTFY